MQVPRERARRDGAALAGERQAQAAKAALEHFPARPMGVVVTGVRAGDELDYGYYSYAYAYGAKA